MYGIAKPDPTFIFESIHQGPGLVDGGVNMTPIEIFQITADISVAATFWVLIVQVMLSRKERRHDVYERVNSQWIEHMSRVIDHPEIEQIWSKFEPSRINEFKKAEKAKKAKKAKKEEDRSGAVWKVMCDIEKKCYRYVRVALEIFEVAYKTHGGAGKKSNPVITKWDNQILLFLNSPYFDYVLEDTEERLDQGFVQHIQELREKEEYEKHGFG